MTSIIEAYQTVPNSLVYQPPVGGTSQAAIAQQTVEQGNAAARLENLLANGQLGGGGRRRGRKTQRRRGRRGRKTYKSKRITKRKMMRGGSGLDAYISSELLSDAAYKNGPIFSTGY